MLNRFYKLKELLSLHFLTTSKKNNLFLWILPMEKVSECWFSPSDCYHGSFQEQAWARGRCSASTVGGSVGRKVPSAPASLRGSLCWGLRLTAMAGCPVPAGSIGDAWKLPHYLAPWTLPAGCILSHIQGFQEVPERWCPGQLPTQIPPPSAQLKKPIHTQVVKHWTSCEGRWNSMTSKCPPVM